MTFHISALEILLLTYYPLTYLSRCDGVCHAGRGSVDTSLVDTQTITRLQDDAQLALNRYIDATQAVSQSFRLGKLLFLLVTLRSFTADTIEQLYFRSTLGDIRVSRIVADMVASAYL